MKYFKTDGIRGKTNEYITLKLLYKIGRALAILNNNVLFVGYDSRYFGDELLRALAIGATSKKMRVYNLKIMPTPGIMYYSLKYQALGVSITASHNLYYDNGVKIFLNGEKISADLENKIEEEIDAVKYLDFHLKKVDKFKDKIYLSFLKQNITKTNYKYVIDCSNGATSKIAKKLFSNTIASKPNGKNINKGVGSVNPDYLIKYLNKHNYDYGYALDGDGDRIILADKDRVYYGDDILYLILKFYKDNNIKLKKIIMSKMSNIGVVNKIREMADVYLCDVGDKNLLEGDIGAEPSGHIILKDILPYGDGLYMITLLNKIINYYGLPVNKLFDYKRYDELNYTINNSLIKKNALEINKFESMLNEKIDGKIIIRKSGTEDVLRVYISLKNKKEIYKYKKNIDDYLGGI